MGKLSFLRSTVAKPKATPAVKSWVVWLDWILKLLIFISAIAQMILPNGEFSIGALTMVALIAISAPQVITRNRISHIPIEIEIFLFVMVFFQLVIGEARDWYTNVPYYDKFVHMLLPALVGLIGFYLVYTLYFYKLLLAPIWAMALIVILSSIGIGALWEIFEYASDELLYPVIPGWHHFQGSLTEDALHDTMNDLIADTIGGTIGALVAIFYIKKASTSNPSRLHELFAEIGTQYGLVRK